MPSDSRKRATERIGFDIMFQGVHEAGAERHPHTWFIANHRAVAAMWAASVDTSDPRMKYMVSRVVLNVLDAISEK